MRPLYFLSALLLLLLAGLSSAFSSQQDHRFSACVNDEAGHALIYVSVRDNEGAELIQSDLNGCFTFSSSATAVEVALSFPGYEAVTVKLQADEHAQVTLLKTRYLPTVQSPSGETVTPTESRGAFTIKGQVLSNDKEPLIGASILIVGSKKGTICDLDGRFELHTDTKCVELLISYTGFESLVASDICTTREHTFTLEEGARLEEVVVTGMARASRKEARSYSLYLADDAVRPAAPLPPPPPPPPGFAGPAPTAAMPMPTEYSALSAKSATADRVYDSREAAFMAGEPHAPSVGSGAPSAASTLPTAGQLTTGEINDFSKWDRWADISQEDLGQYRSTWQQYADHRYTLQLTTPTGGAVVNAAVELKDGQGNVLWKAHTDAQGRAELWAHYFRDVATPANGLAISGSYQGRTFAVKTAKPFSEGVNFHTLAAPCRDQAVIDMAFVVDATGSMGDEIQYLQAELLDVIRRVQDSLPTADLRMGSVFYRDLNEQYLTLTQPLTADASKAVAFLQEQSASGGGDYPEAVEAALEAATDSLQWRPEATTRLLFLVLDAPPHQAEENIKRLQVAVTKAAQLGIQIVPVSCSGVDKSTEYLLRNMALATNGTYTFITDHSGIGDAHIEPSTDTYEVEFLNDVLVRLTVSRSRLAACERPIAAVTADPTAVATTTTRDWQFFPNPTNGAIQLDFPAAGGLLYLADANGKILQRLATNPQLKMDLTGYPAGTYWLRHEDATGQWTQGQVLLVGQ